MSLTITPQTTEEFEAYYLFRWTMLRAPWQQPQGSEQDELESQSFHRMIIDSNTNEIIAIGRLHFIDQFKAQIRYMAVSPDHQGQGLGKKLLSALEQVAIERGAQSIALHARESAQAFYLASDYQAIEKSHLLYGEIQHHLMLKTLVPAVTVDGKEVRELEQTWHQTIPLSKAMNIHICHYQEDYLIAGCDPDFNKNLHNTMFAGSIYTLATLSGWGWVHMQLKRLALEADIVLGAGDIRYLKPVAGVSHTRVTVENASGNLEAIRKGRRGKMKVIVEVCCGDIVCATFSGKYVAMPKA